MYHCIIHVFLGGGYFLPFYKFFFDSFPYTSSSDPLNTAVAVGRLCAHNNAMLALLRGLYGVRGKPFGTAEPFCFTVTMTEHIKFHKI